MITQSGQLTTQLNQEKIYQLINNLNNVNTIDKALYELSSRRDEIKNLACLLWFSFGSITTLLKEIVACYQYMNPPMISQVTSNRVCNCLVLLQCIASHSETRTLMLEAKIPLFLYPFLQTNNVLKDKPFEYLRLTSLGVIGALVKSDQQNVIDFLLSTEIIPLCLRIMESGNELNKTVATFILQKILIDDAGLDYVCHSYNRFKHVASVLDKMIISLTKEPSSRLLKHIIRCYLRLSENHRAREALRLCLPDQLKNGTFEVLLKEEKVSLNWLNQLIINLNTVENNETSN